jgi:dGTP triphosphohydrolase
MSGQHIFAIQLQKVRAAITALIAEGILPAGIDQSRLAVEPSRLRRTADFIAGMTDRYALIEHARLFDSTPELR